MNRMKNRLLICALAMAITGCSKSPEELLSKQLDIGQKYLDELNYEEAIVAYLKAIELDPKEEIAYLNLSWIYVEQEEYDKAIDLLDDALDNLPESKNILQIRERLVPTVSCSADERAYSDRLTVELESVKGSKIYYTLSSELDTGEEILYKKPFELDKTGEYHLSYYAVSEYGTKGEVQEQEIKIQLPESEETSAAIEIYYKYGWFEDDGTWYYGDGNGNRKTGWQTLDGKWYYFHSDGAMASDEWIDDCYLGADGAMLVNCWTPDGYYVGEDGKWISFSQEAESSDQPELAAVPYKAQLDKVMKQWAGTYENGDFGLHSDIEDIEDAEWIEYDSYYVVKDVYLSVFAEQPDYTYGIERLAHFDELRIMKNGTYSYGEWSSSGEWKNEKHTVSEWIAKRYWPRWGVTFDENGYIVAFEDAAVN